MLNGCQRKVGYPYPKSRNLILGLLLDATPYSPIKVPEVQAEVLSSKGSSEPHVSNISFLKKPSVAKQNILLHSNAMTVPIVKKMALVSHCA